MRALYCYTQKYLVEFIGEGREEGIIAGGAVKHLGSESPSVVLGRDGFQTSILSHIC